MLNIIGLQKQTLTYLNIKSVYEFVLPIKWTEKTILIKLDFFKGDLFYEFQA